MTFYLYVFWSMPRRALIWNYLLLIFSLILVLTAANTAFTLYGGLSLVVFTIYRLANIWVMERRELWRQGGVLFMAGVSAFLMSAVRIIPCIAGVMDSNRIAENYYTIQDRIPLITRLFLPEITGWLGSHSLNALTSDNLNLASKWINLPSNPQNAFFVYFGIIAGLFLIFNIFVKTNGRHKFWKVYSFTALALGLMIQPLWGIFNILLFPFNHYSYYIIILPIGVCALLGYTGLYLENKNSHFSEIAPRLALSILVIQLYLVVIVTYLFPAVTVYTKWTLAVLAVGFVFYNKRGKLAGGKYFFIEAALWISFLFISTALFVKPIPEKEMAVPLIVIPVLGIFLILLAAFRFYRHCFQKTAWHPRKLWMVGAAVPLFSMALVYSPLFNYFISTPEAERFYWSDFLLGEMKFVLIVMLFFAVLVFFEKKEISRRTLWGVIFIIALLDLLAFNARFDNVVAPTPQAQAFYPSAAPYRDMDAAVKKNLDLINYRAHMLDGAGLNANKNLIFKVPSYSGIMGHMPKRFSNFIINFGYPRETVLIYPSEASTHERFLDLSAVRYVFTQEGKSLERPTALARLNVVYNYRVITNENKLLEELKNESFDPRETVLLAQDPYPTEGRWTPGTIRDSERRLGQAVPILTTTGDVVAAEVSVTQPSLLLFAESYDKGWKCFIDGKPAPVYIANYNFMACPIGPGEHKVTFQFAPPLFFLSLKLSLVGGVLFLILCGYFGFGEIKK